LLLLFCRPVCGYWDSGGSDGGWVEGDAVKRLCAPLVAPTSEKSGVAATADDRILGVFWVGASARLARYKGRRGAWREKVLWKEGEGDL